VRERSIIHINAADFPIAVERSIDPRLRDRPVVIASAGASRAAVIDMSNEAYHAGINKGMPLNRARRLCRDLVVVPPHADRWERAMQELLKRATPYSPLIEMVDDNGHLFIDTTGTERLFGPAYDVAWRIRRTVRDDLGIDPIWSVAPNKLTAKVASRTVKPAGEYILEPGQELDFLHPLPAYLLPGLEYEDLVALREFQLDRIGQICAWTLPQLKIAYPRRAQFLYESSRGIDRSPVLPLGQRPPAATAAHEFGNDEIDLGQLEAVLLVLAERIGAELRERRLAARHLTLVIDHADGVRVTRQTALAPPTSSDFRLFDAAKAIVLAWTRRVRVRHLRLVADRLSFPPLQLNLFAAPAPNECKKDRLISALDQVRGKFGTSAIRLGRTLAASSV
jgi:DNA polymerase-4